ncbi:MAG: NADPH-dependent F420 reductase [Bifidobacteriaceae bacterium]|nr:NADPH-dependent F420 reductase [Bifidobacteriaceae bacterium]
MATVTIFGKGNMGSAIKGILEDGGATVQALDSHDENPTIEGSIVILAVPYPALASIAKQYGDQLAGKTVVDITNPLDFSTFDSLVVPADSSAAAELQALLPNSHVLKAFNTVFAANIASKKTGDAQTTVLVAGDDDDAKAEFIDLVKAGGLDAIDAGALKRARELEAMGFLQLVLAVQKKLSFTAGFAIYK